MSHRRKITRRKMEAIPAGYGVFIDTMRSCGGRSGVGRLSVGRSDVIPFVKSMSNVRSDTEDLPCGSGTVTFTLDTDDDILHKDRTIHSGHFMVSHIHDDSANEDTKPDVADDESDSEVVVSDRIAIGDLRSLGFEPDVGPRSVPSLESCRSNPRTPSHLAIDTSLTKLFDCMTLAYSGKLKTPKWKNFKGIRVGLKDKIRLNNLIWREWHMQYKQGRLPIGCQFVTPLPDKAIPNELDRNEVSYWRLRLEAVTNDYRKWNNVLCKKLGQNVDASFVHHMRLQRVSRDRRERSTSATVTALDEQGLQDDLDLPNLMDVSDTLFSSLLSTSSAQNSRELYALSCVTADMMQPDLDPFQPSFGEEYMDTLEAPAFRFGAESKFGNRFSGFPSFAGQSSCGSNWIDSLTNDCVGAQPTAAFDTGDGTSGQFSSQAPAAPSIYDDNSSAAVPNIYSDSQNEMKLFQNATAVNQQTQQRQQQQQQQQVFMEPMQLYAEQQQQSSTQNLSSTVDTKDIQQFAAVGIDDQFGIFSQQDQFAMFGGQGATCSPVGVVNICGQQQQRQNMMTGSVAQARIPVQQQRPQQQQQQQQFSGSVPSLSFGSSEEIAALMMNQASRDATLDQQAASASQGNQAAGGGGSSTAMDAVTVAYSDEVLQQLLTLLFNQNQQQQQQQQHLPVILETSSASVSRHGSQQDTKPFQVTRQAAGCTQLFPVTHHQQQQQQQQQQHQQQHQQQASHGISSHQMVNPSVPRPGMELPKPAACLVQSTDVTKETHSLDNLLCLIMDPGADVNSRRASTGSMGGQQVPLSVAAPAGFRVPQLIAPMPNPKPPTIESSQPATLKRSPATLGSHLTSGISQRSETIQTTHPTPTPTLRKTATLLTPLQHLPQVAASAPRIEHVPLKTQLRPSASLGGPSSQLSQAAVAANKDAQLFQQRRRSSVLEQLLTHGGLSEMTQVVTSSQMRSGSEQSLSFSQAHQSTPLGGADKKQRRTRHKTDSHLLRPGDQMQRGVAAAAAAAAAVAASSSSPQRPPPTDIIGQANAVFQPINPLASALKQVHSAPKGSPVSFASRNLLTVAGGAAGHKMSLSAARGSASSPTTVGGDSSSSRPAMIRSLASDPSDLVGSRQRDRARHASSESPNLNLDDLSLARGGTPTQQDLSREHRRVSHITSEQRRRCSIKSGFDTLNRLTPGLAQSSNCKISKATTLHKTAEHCKKLKQERAQMRLEIEHLNNEIKSLDAEISSCQSQLPASGMMPGMSQHRAEQSRDQLNRYIASRTLDNWKFWIFGFIVRSLFESFDNAVVAGNWTQFQQSLLAWLDEQCSLIVLRRAILNSIREIATGTSALSDPSQLPREATQAATSYLSKRQ